MKDEDMAFRFVIEGVGSLENKLNAMLRSVEGKTVIEVGFRAKYAIYVHEAVAMKLKGLIRDGGWPGHYWDPQGEGRAKFLEEPARTKAPEIFLAIKTAVRNGQNWVSALLTGGNLLLYWAKSYAPLRMGDLRRSGYCVQNNRGFYQNL